MHALHNLRCTRAHAHTHIRAHTRAHAFTRLHTHTHAFTSRTHTHTHTPAGIFSALAAYLHFQQHSALQRVRFVPLPVYDKDFRLRDLQVRTRPARTYVCARPLGAANALGVGGADGQPTARAKAHVRSAAAALRPPRELACPRTSLEL